MWSSSKSAFLLLSAHMLLVNGQSCPELYIFGARETTASAGFGSAGAMIDMIIADHPNATSEAITYPACGGQSSCGSVSYADSAKAGTSAVATAVNDFNTKCPDTHIVLVGYSQVSLLLKLSAKGRNTLLTRAKGRSDYGQRPLWWW